MYLIFYIKEMCFRLHYLIMAILLQKKITQFKKRDVYIKNSHKSDRNFFTQWPVFQFNVVCVGVFLSILKGIRNIQSLWKAEIQNIKTMWE